MYRNDDSFPTKHQRKTTEPVLEAVQQDIFSIRQLNPNPNPKPAKNEQTYGNLMAVMPEELFLLIEKTNHVE